MTECCTGDTGVGRGGFFVASEVTVAEMVSQAAYRVVGVVEAAWQHYSAYRSTMRALNRLSRLDDHHLADIGVGRSDLTVDGLAEAAARRNRATAAMARRA